MNQLLFGSLLVIALNADKCNEEKPESANAEPGMTEQPATGQPETQPKTQPEENNGLQEVNKVTGQRWYFITLYEEAMGLPDGAERPWLELNDQQLQGFGGCNNLMGSYTLEGSRIHFMEVGSTKKYCPELQAVERSILDMFAEVNGYRSEDDTLVLLQGTREVAMLKTTEE